MKLALIVFFLMLACREQLLVILLILLGPGYLISRPYRKGRLF